MNQGQSQTQKIQALFQKIEDKVRSERFSPSDEDFDHLLREVEDEILVYDKYCQDDKDYF